jgi:hypothetical protein
MVREKPITTITLGATAHHKLRLFKVTHDLNNYDEVFFKLLDAYEKSEV